MENIGTTCSSLLLNCFSWNKWSFYILSTVLLPYLAYQMVANKVSLKRRRFKSFAEHFECIVKLIGSSTLLWFLGNYEETFSSTTAISVFVGLFGFALLAEKDKENSTLVTYSKWNYQMKTLMTHGTISVVLILFYHLMLANNHDFFKEYFTFMLLPIVFLFVSSKIAGRDNLECSRSESCTSKTILHLHHTHLFYMLAFFTRFPETVSQLAAGLFIGASLHGVAAYDFDKIFEKVSR